MTTCWRRTRPISYSYPVPATGFQRADVSSPPPPGPSRSAHPARSMANTAAPYVPGRHRHPPAPIASTSNRTRRPTARHRGRSLTPTATTQTYGPAGPGLGLRARPSLAAIVLPHEKQIHPGRSAPSTRRSTRSPSRWAAGKTVAFGHAGPTSSNQPNQLKTPVAAHLSPMSTRQHNHRHHRGSTGTTAGGRPAASLGPGHGPTPTEGSYNFPGQQLLQPDLPDRPSSPSISGNTRSASSSTTRWAPASWSSGKANRCAPTAGSPVSGPVRHRARPDLRGGRRGRHPRRRHGLQRPADLHGHRQPAPAGLLRHHPLRALPGGARLGEHRLHVLVSTRVR